MPSSQVIQFPSLQKRQPPSAGRPAAEIGAEAIIIASERHSDVYHACDELRYVTRHSPDNAAAIANRIYSMREIYVETQTALTKLLQQMGRT